LFFEHVITESHPMEVFLSLENLSIQNVLTLKKENENADEHIPIF